VCDSARAIGIALVRNETLVSGLLFTPVRQDDRYRPAKKVGIEQLSSVTVVSQPQRTSNNSNHL